MENKLTPTLALIIAGGVAAGIGLARPGHTDPTGTVGPDTAVQADSADSAAEQDVAAGRRAGGYRSGNRPNNRGGTPAAAEPAAEEPTAAEPADQAPAQAASVTIQDFSFVGPGTVQSGATLSVRNQDGVAHTLTFRSGEADTGTLASGVETSITAPTAPGTYAFFCTIHPSMAGQVVVAG